METSKKYDAPVTQQTVIPEDFLEKQWDKSWIYIKTVVDVVHEPILILDKNLCVMSANEPFYRTFQVEEKDTEGKVVYKLGNGQWDIPALRELLEEILPNNTFFNGFEVAHIFPSIGKKVMMLNARQIHYKDTHGSEHYPQIILLAIEDVTEMMTVAESLVEQIHSFEKVYSERTAKLESQVALLERGMKKEKVK